VEDINNLLNSGEVPNMFPYDERAAVLEQCRGLSKKDGLALDTAVRGPLPGPDPAPPPWAWAHASHFGASHFGASHFGASHFGASHSRVV
jgi:hypothetical protein